MKLIGGVYFRFVVTFCWNNQLWQNKRANIVFFWVWKFVFATVMSTQGCVYVYFLLQQLPGFSLTIFKAVSSHWELQDFSDAALCPLHGRLSGYGSFVGFFPVRCRPQIQTVHSGWLGSRATGLCGRTEGCRGIAVRQCSVCVCIREPSHTAGFCSFSTALARCTKKMPPIFPCAAEIINLSFLLVPVFWRQALAVFELLCRTRQRSGPWADSQVQCLGHILAAQAALLAVGLSCEEEVGVVQKHAEGKLWSNVLPFRLLCSHIGAPVVVNFSFWHRFASQYICFICKFCALFDSKWKIFPLTWTLTISLLCKHQLELEGTSSNWVILTLLFFCWMSFEKLLGEDGQTQAWHYTQFVIAGVFFM